MGNARNALIVATSKYRDARLPPLEAPGQDAGALRRVLGNEGIGGFAVRLALDYRVQTLRKTLETFFARRSRDDLLLVHFSCHGLKDDEGQLYLAAADTEVDLLRATALDTEWLRQLMNDCRSEKIAVFLDCCFGGAFATNMTQRVGVDTPGIKEHLGGSGRVVITASNAVQYAFEGGTRVGTPQPSAFTRALVDGLDTGEADRNQDGNVTINELFEYLADKVHETSPAQTPTKWEFNAAGDWVIARSQRTPRPSIQLLPTDLQNLLTSPDTVHRLAALTELRVLLEVADSTVVESARIAAQQLASDDSRKVSVAATRLLEELPVPPQTGEAVGTPELIEADAERLAAERAEAERVAAGRTEAERAEAERAEAERVAAEREQAEQARLAAEREQAEQARLAAEREQAEQARLAAEREQAEQARLAAEREQAEQARLAAEREQAEQARLAAEREQAEQARLAAEREQAEQARLAAEREQAEQARLAAERETRQRVRRSRGVSIGAAAVVFGGVAVAALAGIGCLDPDGCVPPASPSPPVVATPPGTIVFTARSGDGEKLWVAAADGSGMEQLPIDTGVQRDASWSPDGKQLVYRDPAVGLRIVTRAGDPVMNFTHHGEDTTPAWAPKGGESIVFASDRSYGNLEIYTRQFSALNDPITRLTTDEADDWDPSWSPGGDRIVFATLREGTAAIYTMDRDGANEQPLTNDGAIYDDPAWSPNGTWIAVTRRESASAPKAVWVMRSDGTDAHRLTNSGVSEHDPAWSPDGQFLAFARGNSDKRIVVIDFDGDGADLFTFGPEGTMTDWPDWR